jgi:hypothetical protein
MCAARHTLTISRKRSGAQSAGSAIVIRRAPWWVGSSPRSRARVGSPPSGTRGERNFLIGCPRTLQDSGSRLDQNPAQADRARDGLGARPCVQFSQDGSGVELHRVLADLQTLGDLSIGQAMSHLLQNLEFAMR